MLQQEKKKFIQEITEIGINTASKNLSKKRIEKAIQHTIGDNSLALCFHRVKKSQETRTRDPLTITSRTLNEILQSLENISQASNSGKIFITFDDGYEDSLEYIESHKNRFARLKWIYFICPKKTLTMGRFSWDPPNTPSKLAPLDKCIEISHRLNLSIGNHTNSHRKISSLSINEIRDEINESIDILLSNGINHNHFAYPFGYPRAHFTDEQGMLIRDIYADRKINVTTWTTEPRPFTTNAYEPEVPRIALMGTDDSTSSLSRILMQSIKFKIKTISAPSK